MPSMKRNIGRPAGGGGAHHPLADPLPSSNSAPPAGRAWWRTLEERAQAPQFREMIAREFPSEASVLKNVHSRRAFLQVMGASLSLAGLTGCRWPRENILPFAHAPEDRMPGVPVQYATAFEIGSTVQGLLVTSYDGRPIKVEGNPLHPVNQGAADLHAQASILEMYDPDRSQVLVRGQGRQRFDSNWDEFLDFAGRHFGDLRSRGGEGLRVLSAGSSSPALAAQRLAFERAFPRARWVEWEPLGRDNERFGAWMAFGRGCRAQLDLAAAQVIVSLDSDLLADHPTAIRNARDFASGRKGEDGRMNRLYVVEGTYTLTGGMADHRHIVPTSAVPVVAGRLAAEVLSALGTDLPAGLAPLRDALARFGSHPFQAPFVAAVAADLLRARGRGLVVAGPRQPAEVHALVHLMNEALGNAGRTVRYTAEPDGAGAFASMTGASAASAGASASSAGASASAGAAGRSASTPPPSSIEALRSLCQEMRSGSVGTILILGGNPAFDAPADLAFGDALTQVPHRVHLGCWFDETASACIAPGSAEADSTAWHVPQAHFLESWGDVRAFDGTYSVVQPLIAPLYDGKSALELLAVINGEETSGHDLVRAGFPALYTASQRDPDLYNKDRTVRGGALHVPIVPPGDLEPLWRTVLSDGLLAGSAFPMEAVSIQAGPLLERLAAFRPEAPSLGRENLEVVFCRDAKVHDGRFANNGWLQETPDPQTKLTWDNAALLSPATAASLGIDSDEVLALRYGDRELLLPALIMPGQAPFTVALQLGYGRTAAGRVGNGVGSDVYKLRTSAAPGFDRGLALARTGRRHKLACTQDHHIIDTVGLREIGQRARELVREGTLDEYKRQPDFARGEESHPPLLSLWQEHEYNGHKWGMAIDLTACTGCSACVVACTAENNVPVVGRQRVLEGREMQWIRVDRYFEGDPEDPAVVHQPVACVQCENAPCEQVCPVAATMHDGEGLNVMVYNRCIGTRYCSNNCPFKVRRFNFFNYRQGLSTQEKMAMNPEVTVRSRGVMEKCSYCVQRINAVKITAKNEKRPIADGEILPACAQTCPTQAIVFGDLNDPNSRVARAHAHPRAYAMLGELNIKPRTEYLARLRNPAEGQA